MSCLCKRYNAFRGKSLLMAQTIPVALCIRLFFIWKICFFTIPNVKEITQELYPFSLDSVSHKSCCRNLKKLSEKIQKRLLRAKVEFQTAHTYDYFVINDTVENAVGELNAIITAEHCKPQERMEIISGR